jgi:uncharacterized protein YecE (DUF72 family)
VGTSGFAYPSWVPRFYAPGRASRRLLEAYAAQLPAVELHNTFYRRPSPEQVEAWLRQTPSTFRFCPKAQRGTAWRAWSDDDPGRSFAWLAETLGVFGERLGCVLLSARSTLERDDAALERVLAAWPRHLSLALELPHPSWNDGAVREQVAAAGATLVMSDWDGREEPRLDEHGTHVYLRLRRTSYAPADVDRWAAHMEPALESGRDVFAFFRHDQDGGMALHARALLARLSGLTGA